MNGWNNTETWLCYTHLSNSYGDYSMMCEYAQSACDACELAEMIREYVESAMPDDVCDLVGDLLTYALESIDFYEIAEAFMEEVEE